MAMELHRREHRTKDVLEHSGRHRDGVHGVRPFGRLPAVEENDFVAVRELGPRTVSMSLILTSCP
jgi:hypothetical protein